MATSQNGWAVLKTSLDPRMSAFRWVTGRTRKGDVAYIFDRLCSRFHAEVEPIKQSHSWGYAYRSVRGAKTGYSNHASGTAIDLNAPKHPLGKRNTFSKAQVKEIRQILNELDDVVRWGGNYTNRPDEMHFEINASAAAVKRVADRLRGAVATKPALGRYVVRVGGANARSAPRVKTAVSRTLKPGESRVFVGRRFNDNLWWLKTVAGSWIPLKDLKKK